MIRVRYDRYIWLCCLCAISLLLAGCATMNGCNDADNFGLTVQVNLPAQIKKDDSQFKDNAGNDNQKPYSAQQPNWRDTGLVTNGDAMIVRVQGGWCPVGVCMSHGVAITSQYISPTPVINLYGLNNLPLVDVVNAVGTRAQCPYCSFAAPPNGQGSYGKWFANGEGLYLLFQRPNDANPNTLSTLIANPVSCTIHMGHFMNHGQWNSSAQMPMDQYLQPCTVTQGMHVWIKILDSYYYDNSGEYSVYFVHGFVKPGMAMPFEWIRKNVEALLYNAAQNQFLGIINQKSYKDFVIAAISIYVVLSAAAYVTSMARKSLGDVIMRLVRMSFVAVLLSPQGWNFYNDVLFSIFTNMKQGVIEIMATGSSSDYNSSSPFAFLDMFLWNEAYSQATREAKLGAMLSGGDIMGLLWIIAFCLILVYFTYMAAYGVCVYLVCMLGIYFLMAVFPIAIIGILFPIFKSTFDAWLSQAISMTVQSIMIMASIIYFVTFLQIEMYKTLGFKSCRSTVFDFDLLSVGKDNGDSSTTKLFSIEMFVPGEANNYITVNLAKFSSLKHQQRYKFKEILSLGYIPPDYKVIDYRYIEDLPFLDPNPNSNQIEDASKWRDDPLITSGRDYQRIDGIFHNNTLVRFQDIFCMIIMTVMLGKVMDMSGRLGQFLAINGMSLVATSGSVMDGILTDARRAITSTNIGRIIDQQTIGRIETLQHRIGIFGDRALDQVDRFTSVGGVSLIGAHVGVNARAKAIYRREQNLKYLNMYRDATGGTIDWVSDKMDVGVPLAKMAYLGTGLPSVSGTMEMVAEGRDAKGVFKGYGGDFGKALTSSNNIHDSFKDHMARVLDRYRQHHIGDKDDSVKDRDTGSVARGGIQDTMGKGATVPAGMEQMPDGSWRTPEGRIVNLKDGNVAITDSSGNTVTYNPDGSMQVNDGKAVTLYRYNRDGSISLGDGMNIVRDSNGNAHITDAQGNDRELSQTLPEGWFRDNNGVLNSPGGVMQFAPDNAVSFSNGFKIENGELRDASGNSVLQMINDAWDSMHQAANNIDISADSLFGSGAASQGQDDFGGFGVNDMRDMSSSDLSGRMSSTDDLFSSSATTSSQQYPVSNPYAFTPHTNPDFRSPKPDDYIPSTSTEFTPPNTGGSGPSTYAPGSGLGGLNQQRSAAPSSVLEDPNAHPTGSPISDGTMWNSNSDGGNSGGDNSNSDA